jgi:hypothetical protein
MSGIKWRYVAAKCVKHGFNLPLLPCMSISDSNHETNPFDYTVPSMFEAIKRGTIADLVDYLRSQRSLIL